MVDPHVGNTDPQPYDLVYLRPDNAVGAPAGTPLMVADTVDDAPGILELTRLTTDPAYWDWAAAVTRADIARVVRVTEGAPRSWTLPPR